MPKPYPKEFRDDVVRVARDREGGVTIEQIETRSMMSAGANTLTESATGSREVSRS